MSKFISPIESNVLQNSVIVSIHQNTIKQVIVNIILYLIFI